MGGTRITITGTNFPIDEEIVVNIGFDACTIVSKTRTQIVAETPLRSNLATGVENVAVILKGTDEAYCTDSTGALCTFTWATSETPFYDTATAAWDAGSSSYQVTIAGTGFGTDTASTRVKVGTAEQTIVSVTDTSIVAQLVDIDRSDNVQVALYATKGYAGVKTVTIEPKMTQVSPQAGSKAGTEITFTTIGVGRSDEITSSLAGTVVSRTYTSVTFRTNSKN